jgi:MFS family permease
MLVGARMVQGIGAAMMLPAALSRLTTTFTGRDRHLALGVWGGVAGFASAVGVLLGGVLSEGPGWRWVLLVNEPVCVAAVIAVLLVFADDRRRPDLRRLDLRGAVLSTSGMLLLVYSLVKAPDVGWGTTRTIAELAGAAVILASFVINELRVKNPLVPLSILRVRGVAIADATQLVAVGGFVPMFFFLTLYMQTVLHFSPIQTGLAYLPLTGGFIISSGIASQLFAKVGTKPVIVVGAVIAAAGLYWTSRIPVDGSYVADILPGILVISLGGGGVFVGVTTAANAGVDEAKAGLAAGLLNTGQQVGTALGLATLSALATAHTSSLLRSGHSVADSATQGYARALLGGAVLVLAGSVVAMLAPNARQAAVTTAE